MHTSDIQTTLEPQINAIPGHQASGEVRGFAHVLAAASRRNIMRQTQVNERHFEAAVLGHQMSGEGPGFVGTLAVVRRENNIE